MRSLLILAALLLAAARAAAQDTPPPQPSPPAAGEQLHVVVEQMPQLPGGGGSRAILEAIGQRFRYPRKAIRQRVAGTILVRFTVTPAGEVAHARIVQSLRADCDSAAVQAVRELPRFEPGRQDGRPVPVSFTVPIYLRLPQ